MTDIKRIHISFSAGETSAWMTYYLLRVKYKCIYNEDLQVHEGVDDITNERVHIVVTFANTGQENEETLIFADKCDRFFGFRTVWLEAVPRFKVGGVVLRVIDFLSDIFSVNWIGDRLGTVHKIVDFNTADRSGIVYESVIARYGLPNVANSFCTRELKLRPMKSYLKSIGWSTGGYYSAIGIRADEFDRINPEKDILKLIYPCVSMKPMTKPKINGFWALQPFRLNLKGYQGNCRWCFKKSDPKLWQIAKEDPAVFDFPLSMEDKYGEYITPDRLKYLQNKGKDIPKVGDRRYRFFRKGRGAIDILEESIDSTKQVVDDSQVYETESCEIYSNCGDK